MLIRVGVSTGIVTDRAVTRSIATVAPLTPKKDPHSERKRLTHPGRSDPAPGGKISDLITTGTAPEAGMSAPTSM